MNIYGWMAVIVAAIVFLFYVRIWVWFYIPKDPFSRALEEDMYAYGLFPPPLLWLHEQNLAWRLNVAKRADLRRKWKAGHAAYSKDDTSFLAMVMGRPISV